MLISELVVSIREETEALHSDGFVPIITRTDTVPAVDDPDITYPNLVDMTQRVKLLESCVLYVDLRESTRISNEHHEYDLTEIYSAYIRAMTRCGNHFGGHVRNIIGDRVVVVFDRENCFLNAVNTAVLMSSVVKYILDPAVYNETMACGIGIDYGQMIVTKTGIIKRGVENTSNKSLVWLGKPANVASKLTDVANKPQSGVVRVAYAPPGSFNWVWRDISIQSFVSELQKDYTRVIRHQDPNMASFYTTPASKYPPILMTEAVREGLEQEAPADKTVVENMWSEYLVEIGGYTGKIYGADVFYPAVKDV